MGPVSFERVGSGLDLDRLRQAARALTERGVRVEVLDDHDCLVVRSEDAAEARAVVEAIASGSAGPAETALSVSAAERRRRDDE